MTKNYKAVSRKSAFVYVPWWIYVATGCAIFYFFEFEIGTFHLNNQNNDRVIFALDALLHTRFAKYSSYIVEFSLAIYAAKSFWHSYSRKRFTKKARNIEALKSMPWQEFEMLVAAVYRKTGYKVQETGLGGADGGIDLVMFLGDEKTIVQCKRWGATSIGAPIVREMYGLMAHHEADSVKIVCVGKFTKEAINFAAGKPIDLVSGEAFLELLKEM